MTIFAFQDRDIAATLKQMAIERKGTPLTNRGGKSGQPPQRPTFIRSYLAVPNERIPGAVRIYGPDTNIDSLTNEYTTYRWRLKLGSGLCTLHQRNLYPWDQTDHADANDGSNLYTRPAVDLNRTTIQRRVYNFSSEAIEVNENPGDDMPCGDQAPILYVVEDMWGSLYAVKEISMPCTSSASSSESVGSSVSSAGSVSSSESVCENKFTGSIEVCIGDPERVYDNIVFPMQELHFKQGVLCYVEDISPVVVDICCSGEFT